MKAARIPCYKRKRKILMSTDNSLSLPSYEEKFPLVMISELELSRSSLPSALVHSNFAGE